MGSRSSSTGPAEGHALRPRRVQLSGTDVVVGSAAAMLAIACIVSPSASTTGPILCPFREATGLPCPGCGMTRAWVAAAHGDVVASFLYNPFGLAFFAIALLIVGWRVAAMVRPARIRPVSLDWLSNTRVGWAFLGSWVVFGVARLGYVWSNGPGSFTGAG